MTNRRSTVHYMVKEGKRDGNHVSYDYWMLAIILLFEWDACLCVVGGQVWLSPDMPGVISPTA